MIFNSFEFILIFLPLTFLAFAAAERIAGWQAAFKVIVVASLIFYGQWSLGLLALLMVSVISNYVIGKILIQSTKAGNPSVGLMIVGIIGNLAALGYFKYTNFFLDVANQVTGGGYSHLDIILPVGISFYTFIQIGFLVEAHSGQAEQQSFTRYLTFATFFPCVTAGPLVLQREIFDQMNDRTDSALDFRRIAAGVAMFSMGLFKKVILADSIAPYANGAFNGVAAGQSIDVLTAWAGSTAYALQLYFDFSGYTDMAVGLGAIFGIMLPLNFNSPFKALSISDFWQRWHMSMTRFFTKFVYSPMAMSGMRKAVAGEYGPVRRYMVSGGWPIVLTMLVAGFWHGSGWPFIVYGLMHGLAIAINNGWKHFNMPQPPAVVGWMLTMSVVVSGLVVFRAPDLQTSMTILSSMWGVAALVEATGTEVVSLALNEVVPLILFLGTIVLVAPNTQELVRNEWLSCSPKPAVFSRLSEKLFWRPSLGWSFAMTFAFVAAFACIQADSSFLYYKF